MRTVARGLGRLIIWIGGVSVIPGIVFIVIGDALVSLGDGA